MTDLRTDNSAFDIQDGLIHWWLYRQDGGRQPMVIKDTEQNRRFVSWCRIHDRYTPHENPHTEEV